MEKSLEKIISAKIKNVKNKTLTEDYIIKKRLKLLENYNLKKGVNKKNRIDDIITEMFLLKQMGYKTTIINENIFDWFKNVLGVGDDTAIEPLVDTFKESFIGYLMKLFVPNGSNSILGNIIKVGLADIDMNDLDKITDCETLSDIVTKAVVEGTINKLKNNIGLVGGVFNVVRNALVDNLDNSEFAESVKNGISSFICEAIGDKIDVLKDKVADLKG